MKSAARGPLRSAVMLWDIGYTQRLREERMRRAIAPFVSMICGRAESSAMHRIPTNSLTSKPDSSGVFARI